MVHRNAFTSWQTVFVRIVAALVSTIALLVLCGWHLENLTLICLHPTFVPMQYSTALGFLFCGFSLAAFSVGRLRLAGGLGLAPLAAGLLTIIVYLVSGGYGIDNLLRRVHGAAPALAPGHMALTTAISFLLTAVALLLTSRTARDRGHLQAQNLLGAVVVTTNAIDIFGCLTEEPACFNRGDHITIAVRDLKETVRFYTEVLGFEVKRRRKRDQGSSAILAVGPLKVVLVEA